MNKIYDCFTFYNELDLLELRLTELYDFVDHFVLVEADTTYTSRPKPFYYEENKSRYSQWADKIIHIKVTDMPHDPDAWVNDRWQRDQIMRGIVEADDDDIIIVEDADEASARAKYNAMGGDAKAKKLGVLDKDGKYVDDARRKYNEMGGDAKAKKFGVMK